jgi:uncharacterized membrane protein YfhO
MLLPAYYGLQLTYSANNSFPRTVTFYEKWTDIFANMISYNAPAMKEGLPNFACGMLAAVLFGVFLFSGGIKIREKISALFMLALITVSCNMNILNYIWHGFHFTNMIPYRFAFIFSFVLVLASYRAYDVILKKGIKIYQLFLMPIFPAVILLLNYLSAEDREKFTISEPLENSLIISAAFILIFTAVKIFPFKNVRVRNTILSLGIGAAVISECWSNAAIGVKTVGNSDYESYPTSYDEIEELLDSAEQSDDSLFYRTEVTKTYTLNDSSLYGYYGISQFSSAANVSVTKLMKRMGLYASEAGNRYYYRVSTPVFNSLFGLKYLISKDGRMTVSDELMTENDYSGNCYMYENNYALSLGYMVSSDILTLDNDKYYESPLVYQNEIMKLASGIDKDCFTPQPVALASYEGMDVTKQGYGNYNFKKDKTASTNAVTYTFNGIDHAYLFGYASNGGCDTARVYNNDSILVDGNIQLDDYSVVFPMGDVQGDGTAQVKLIAKSDSESGNYKLMVYALDMDTFNEEYSRLADEQLQITEFSDTEIKGTVTALEDGILMLSVPYEKGWTVFSDGEKVETTKVADALLGAKITAGEHEIVIRYVPEGFTTGVAATSTGAVAFAVTVFVDKRRKNKSVPHTDTVSAGGDGDDDTENTESSGEYEES